MSYPAYVAWLTSQQRAKKTNESGNENLVDSIWTPQSISPVDFLDMLDGEGQVKSEGNQELIENKLAVCAVSSEFLSHAISPYQINPPVITDFSPTK